MGNQHTLEALFAELGMKANMSMVILTIALLMCRVLPTVIFSPILGGDTTPSDVKLGLGLVISLVFYPVVQDRVTLVPTTALAFIAVLFKEVFVGLSLSFIVSTVFEAARSAGTFIDTQAGSAQAQVHVPAIQQQATIYSSFNMMLAVTLFLTLNGHHIVFEAIADSLAVIPLDRFPRFGHGLWAFFELILRVFGEMMKVAMALAAPAAIAALLADLSLGFINRVAPQLQVFFIAMALKPLVAALMTFCAIHLILWRMNDEFIHTLGWFKQAITLLK